MILKFFRSFFLVMARKYRSAGFSHLLYYPDGTMGHARGELLFKIGNVCRALCRKEK